MANICLHCDGLVPTGIRYRECDDFLGLSFVNFGVGRFLGIFMRSPINLAIRSRASIPRDRMLHQPLTSSSRGLQCSILVDLFPSHNLGDFLYDTRDSIHTANIDLKKQLVKTR